VSEALEARVRACLRRHGLLSAFALGPEAEAEAVTLRLAEGAEGDPAEALEEARRALEGAGYDCETDDGETLTVLASDA
jgi:hypothetical protein